MAANILIITVLVFVIGIIASHFIKNSKHLNLISVVVSALSFASAIAMCILLYKDGPIKIFNSIFAVDSLCVFHLLLVNAVFFAASIYSADYFKEDTRSATDKRRYYVLWLAFLLMLNAVLLSNNIGVMWIAIEATTLISAFLILSRSEPLSVEAMWKYILICSVGIAFAFIGILLTVSASRAMPNGDDVYFLSKLSQNANLINPKLMLFAFIFIVVGFGTKAGLAPMHTWLPDAHSQAPTPVSAVFSGVMLNCALYAIMRFLPIAEAAQNFNGEAREILVIFGFASLIMAAIFIPVQSDIKRFLAYCSIEHMGIIAIGLGLGGIGVFAALLHTLNHSLSKTLSFFSAGKISHEFNVKDMSKIRGAISAVPVWGGVFFVSVLVLIGVAPFGIFYSEILILKQAFIEKKFLTASLFLFSAIAVFIGSIKHILPLSFGEAPFVSVSKIGLLQKIIIFVFFAALLMCGLFLPMPMQKFLNAAAHIIKYGMPI